MVQFAPGLPAQNSPIVSADVRNNFAALYQSLQTLEPDALTPNSTAIQVQGGPVYFRSGTSNNLQFINFQTTVINLATANGWKTVINADGSLTRAPVTGGISPFTQTGLFREILISLNNLGRLVFIEGDTTSTGLSRPFDIAYDDSEIPICLVVVQQTGTLLTSGQLQPIAQIDITDVRPFISTAFQNNSQVATLESTVSDNTSRITIIEPTLRVTQALQVQLPSTDLLTAQGTLTTNTQLQVISGDFYAQSQLIRFRGGVIDFSQSAFAPPVLNANYFNQALVALQFGGTGPQLITIHGTAQDSNASPLLTSVPDSISDGYGGIIVPYGVMPLAMVLYRMASGSGTTTAIQPLVSTTFVGGIRVNYSIPIIAISSVTQFVVQIPTDFDPTVPVPGGGFVFAQGQYVDISDDNTRPFRLTIANNPILTFSVVTRQMTIQVTSPFVDINLLRNPVATSIQNMPAIDDIRPFLSL